MNFNTIEEFYAFLETNINGLDIWNDDVAGLRQLINIQNNDELKRHLVLETYVFEWRLENGECKSNHSIVYKDGSTYEYPNFYSFEEGDYVYLVQRANTVSNDFLIARYNQILWNSPKEHKQSSYLQARAAIDAYLRILNDSNCFSEEKQGNNCIDILFNALELASHIKYRVEDCKKLYKKWLFNEGQLHRHIKGLLLKRLSENSNIKKVDLKGATTLLEKLSEQNIKEEGDLSWRLYYCETGLKVAQKCNEETKSWNKNIGDCYVAMAEARMNEESNMIPIDFLRNAILYYKAAGLIEEIEKNERVISELRANVGLSEITYTIEGDKAKILLDFISDMSEKILT